MRADLLGPVVRIELLHALLVGGLWIVLLPTRVVEPWALLVGAVFMGVNFLSLSYGIRWVLAPFAGRGKIRTGLTLLVLKLGLFLGVISSLFLRVQVDPLSFTFGFSSLLLAIVLERLWALRSIGE
jgi:hypothetical protein